MTFNQQYLNELIKAQVSSLLENGDMEGFEFGRRGRGQDNRFAFTPGRNEDMTSTRIFDDQGNMMVRKIFLPKSGIISYNLYKIGRMDVSRALKHPEKLNREINQESIQMFMARTALYIKHLLGNTEIDYITCPQSSSQFNKDMINHLLRLYPKSYGFKFVPDLLTKNVRKVFVNVNVAKSIGLTDNEIHELQQRVDKWKSDEDLRDLRRKIQALQDEIEQEKMTRGRGRPSRVFTNKVDKLQFYNDQISFLRKGKRGKDPTLGDNGNVKDFQIKSIDDKWRRSLEDLFEINPQYKGIQQKLVGKNVLVFDDNISSGATLDDICLTLKRVGVANIIPITLGVIPKTIYGAHERL